MIESTKESWNEVRRTWEEFRETGLLWWINRQLHLFGWAIAVALDKDENGNLKVVDVFPARVDSRGFSEKSEDDGFIKLTKYLQKEVNELVKDVCKEDNNGD